MTDEKEPECVTKAFDRLEEIRPLWPPADVHVDFKGGRSLRLYDANAVDGHFARIERMVERLRGLLRQVEWNGDQFGERVCPRCGGIQIVKPGHEPDCELAAELEGK